MKIALRLGVLAAAALLLPSCRRHWHEWVDVTVHNDGDDPVDVRAEAEYWSGFGWEDHVDLRVPAYDSVELRFRFDELQWLRVRVYRASDHLEIFDESWDRNEIWDEHRRILIAVNP